MAYVAVELQKAMMTALKADAAVNALCGGRIYDRVPAAAPGKIGPVFPFVQIGDDQIIGDADQCADKSEIYSTLHIWSRAVGRIEAKTLAGACKAALELITLPGHAVPSRRFESLKFPAAGDGLTTHGVLVAMFRAIPLG